MIDIPEFTELLTSLGVAKHSDLVGVPAVDIQELEHEFGVKLPRSYRLFLRTMGRSAGYLSPWMAFYFDDLKEIREQFDLLNATQKNPTVLPPKSLIIAHWESVFDFVVCTGNDDPEVFRVDLCSDGEAKPKNYSPSFSQYLVNLAKTADIDEIPADLLEELPLQHYVEDTITY